MPEEKWTDRLKRSYNENPIAFMGAAAMLASGAAKLIDSMSGVKSRRAYARRMDRPRRRGY